MCTWSNTNQKHWIALLVLWQRFKTSCRGVLRRRSDPIIYRKILFFLSLRQFLFDPCELMTACDSFGLIEKDSQHCWNLHHIPSLVSRSSPESVRSHPLKVSPAPIPNVWVRLLARGRVNCCFHREKIFTPQLPKQSSESSPASPTSPKKIEQFTFLFYFMPLSEELWRNSESR